MKSFKNSIWLSVIFLFVISCKKDTVITNLMNESLTGKSADQYASSFLQQWYKLQCTIVKTTDGFFPPQAARAFGYSGVAVYQAAYVGIKGAPSLVGFLTEIDKASIPEVDKSQEYNWAIVVNATIAEMLRSLFEKKITPENLIAINTLETNWFNTLSATIDKDVIDRSVAHGKLVAQTVFNYSKKDGAHESYLNPFELPYTQPTGDDKWIPTNTKFLSPLSPGWGKVRPMLTSNTTFAAAPALIPFSTDKASAFYKEAMNTYNTVTNGSAEQVEITKYWADDPFATCTPTGHTFNILTQLLEENHATLAKALVAYGQLGITENDAFICCWKTKYDYSLIRPVSYIQKYIDAKFVTVIGTPPFPAYTSGHATEMAAGSRIFTRLFTNGSGAYPFTDRSQIQFGFSIRNFNNFDEMATECANSRLYGGIHYDMDNKKGLQMGKGVGDNVSTAIPWPTDLK